MPQRDFGSRTGAGLPARERINGVEVVRVHPGGSPLLALHEWWISRRGGWRSTSWFLGEEFEFQWGRPSGLSTLIPLLRLPADIVATVNWCFGVPYWSRFPLSLRRIPQVAVPILHIDRPWAQRAVYRSMFRACDAAIALNGAEANHIRGEGVADVAVAGGGVDPERFADRDGGLIRRSHQLGDAPVVGFVGRQDHLKGVPTLIDAMQLVWWREKPDVVLLLAGPGAHRDDHVAARLAALAPGERAQVLLIDDFPDVLGPSILDACDLAGPALGRGGIRPRAGRSVDVREAGDRRRYRSHQKSHRAGTGRLDRRALRSARAGGPDPWPPRRSRAADCLRCAGPRQSPGALHLGSDHRHLGIHLSAGSHHTAYMNVLLDVNILGRGLAAE